MRYSHHSHVRATPHAALFHYIRNLIHDVHERNWTRSNSGSGANHRSSRSQELVRHTCATTSLMDGGSGLCMIHNPDQRVGHFQHKTRSQLTVRFTGIHQTWCVGNKLALQHHLAHSSKELVALLSVSFRSRDMADDATNYVGPFLDSASLRIL